MKDYRLRVSSLKSQYRRYIAGKQHKQSPTFAFFGGPYSYYLMDTREFDSYTEVCEHSKKLTENYKDRTKDTLIPGVNDWD